MGNRLARAAALTLILGAGLIASATLAANGLPSLHKAAVAASKPASAAKPAAAPTSDAFATAVAGLTKQDGLLPVYVDKAGGRALLALPAPDADGVAGRYL